jgi:hypothetical protein
VSCWLGSEPTSVLLAWHQAAWASGDSRLTILLHQADGSGDSELTWPSIERFSAGSTTIDSDTREPCLERLPMLLEGYLLQDIHTTNEMGLFYSCLTDRILTLKGQSCHRVSKTGCVTVCEQ